MSLRLVDVSVRYGQTLAVDGVNLEVGPSERLAVLGPSGSGKSTLLRAVAGLEPLDRGRVEWDGSDITTMPPHRRGFGLMFQDYALFPHRDVAGNVAFGLEMRGLEAAQQRKRGGEVLGLVGLRGYERRRTDQLSGGEQQRVALARALAPTPRLLMLDEPLGALDRALRTRLLDDLVTLFRELRLPIIYVTHDQEEALAVGERVAVINHGRLEAVMPAQELWRSPPNEFVARFLGLTNIVPLTLESDGVAKTPWGSLPLPEQPPSGAASLLIRPEAVELAADGPLGGTVVAATFHGDHTSVQVAADSSPDGPILEARLRSPNVPRPTESIRLRVDTAGVLFLP